MKDIYLTLDSDKLIASLEKDNRIKLLGIGDRYQDEKFPGLHDEYWECDNSYNWEMVDEDEEEKRFYQLSNNFEIKEAGRLLVLSKHIGTDIRGGYEDDRIYLKDDIDSFYSMIYEYLHLATVDSE